MEIIAHKIPWLHKPTHCLLCFGVAGIFLFLQKNDGMKNTFQKLQASIKRWLLLFMIGLVISGITIYLKQSKIPKTYRAAAIISSYSVSCFFELYNFSIMQKRDLKKIDRVCRTVYGKRQAQMILACNRII